MWHDPDPIALGQAVPWDDACPPLVWTPPWPYPAVACTCYGDDTLCPACTAHGRPPPSMRYRFRGTLARTSRLAPVHDALVQRYQQGERLADLATAYDVGVTTLCTYLQAHGCAPRYRRHVDGAPAAPRVRHHRTRDVERARARSRASRQRRIARRQETTYAHA